MVKRYFEHKKKFYFVFFILIFNIISIIFIPNSGTNVKNSENLIDNTKSLIKISSGNPPNAHYFKYYKEIIIDHTMVDGPDDLLNFPVLISIFDSDLRYDVQYDGDDIAFANDTAWLNHEIELFNQYYNTTHSQLVAWVKVPILYTSIDTVIRMYYSNSTMSNRENKTEVWDNYQGIWHLSEISGNAKDSTSYDVDGVLEGAVTQNVPGKIARAYDFDRSTNDTVDMGDPIDGHLDFDSDDDFTISFWINLTYFYFYDSAIVTKKAGQSSSYIGYACRMGDDNSGIPNYRVSDNGDQFGVTATNSCLEEGWKYIVYIWDESDSSESTIYFNGVDDKASTAGSIGNVGSLANSIDFRLNGYGNTPSIDYMNEMILDEVRVSNRAYTADWIATEYNNQYDPSNFFTIGPELKGDNIPSSWSNLVETIWIILISILIIIISVLASLTVRSYVILPRKRRKEFGLLLARTQRFKDLRNIQAILIIHKLSGVPIFSKSYSILEKNQNELFSGFIQAITIVSEEFFENESLDTEMVEKILELDLKHFNCLIANEEYVRVAFVLKQKSSERLKSQVRDFAAALNLNICGELENWDGSLDKFQSFIPSILNVYFELYYKEPFIITNPASRAKICKDHELSSMEKHILNVIDSIMKDQSLFYLDKVIKLVDKQNENLVINALESLIKKGLILPRNI